MRYRLKTFYYQSDTNSQRVEELEDGSQIEAVARDMIRNSSPSEEIRGPENIRLTDTYTHVSLFLVEIGGSLFIFSNPRQIDQWLQSRPVSFKNENLIY